MKEISNLPSLSSQTQFKPKLEHHLNVRHGIELGNSDTKEMSYHPRLDRGNREQITKNKSHQRRKRDEA